MALANIDAFVELVRKSDLVEADRLQAYLDKFKAGNGMPADPQKLAEAMVRDSLLTKFQTDQLLAGKWKGFHVGKYKVLELLGTGGMGKVYLAEHKFMRRRVALKVLPRSRVSSDSSLLERFYREAKALGALDHANIVRAYDHDHENDLHFLVMEFVDGASLQEMIRIGGTITWQAAVHYMYQAALGLQHAHEVGLVHRDIKPGNLLVDRTGTVKILDMGLARFFKDEDDILTKKYDENVLGTADYLAPEQAIDSHSVDIRADIYSLGGTIYFTLSGQSPFGEGTVAQKLIWHQTRRPKSLKEARPDVPDEVVAIIDKMMAKDASERYQIPGDVARDLEPWLQGASPPPPDEQMPQLSPLSRTNTDSSGTLQAARASMSKSVPPSGQAAPSTRPSAGPLSPTPDHGNKPRTAPGPMSPSPKAEPRFSTPEPSVPQKRPADRQPPRPATPPAAPEPLPIPEPLPVSAAANTAAAGGDSFPSLLSPPDSPVPARRQPASEPLDAPPLMEPAATEAAAENPFAWEMPAPARESMVKGKTTSRQTSPRTKPKAKAAAPTKRTWLWIGAGAGIVVVTVIVVLIIIFSGGKPKSGAKLNPSAPTKPAAPVDTVFVSKDKVESGDVATIAEALKKVKEDNRLTKIVLRPDTYEEAVRLTRATLKSNLVIEAPPGDDGVSATLIPPKSLSPSEPLLLIDNGATVKVKGLTLDGQKKHDVLVVVRGNCTSMLLEDIKLRGFKKVGLQLDGCLAGTKKGQEAILRGLRIDTQAEKEQAVQAAVSLARDNRFVLFQNCRFEGPCEATVRFEGNSQVHDCTFQGNLFYRGLKYGMAYPNNVSSGTTLDRLQVVNNTFCHYQAGFAIQQQIDTLGSSIELNNNLFYQITQGSCVADGLVSPESLAEVVKGEGNVRETKSPEGNWKSIPKFKLQALTFELTMKSKDAPDFLRFPKSSDLATASDKKSYVGAFPPLE
jgi:serine/threonine protein kinase